MQFVPNDLHETIISIQCAELISSRRQSVLVGRDASHRVISKTQKAASTCQPGPNQRHGPALYGGAVVSISGAGRDPANPPWSNHPRWLDPRGPWSLGCRRWRWRLRFRKRAVLGLHGNDRFSGW